MKKIMFNDKYGLAQAVLEGRKTMTRRVAFSEDVKSPQFEFLTKGTDAGKLALCDKGLIVAKSSYRFGEVVAVAQSYMDAGYDRDMIMRATFRTNAYGGKQIGDFEICLLPGWKNKMYVSPSMMPHQIRITNVRVERLQDISDENCLKEGVLRVPKVDHHFNKTFYYTFEGAGEDVLFYTPKAAFAALIDKVSGKGTWESNPWVFVYEFELVR